MNKLLRKLLFLLLVSLLFATSLSNNIYAFSSVLGTKIVVEETIVDGFKVENPETEFAINTNTPIFSGHAVANTKLILTIKSKPITSETLTDDDGY